MGQLCPNWRKVALLRFRQPQVLYFHLQLYKPLFPQERALYPMEFDQSLVLCMAGGHLKFVGALAVSLEVFLPSHPDQKPANLKKKNEKKGWGNPELSVFDSL